MKQNREEDFYPSIGLMYPSVLDELEPPVESEVHVSSIEDFSTEIRAALFSV